MSPHAPSPQTPRRHAAWTSHRAFTHQPLLRAAVVAVLGFALLLPAPAAEASVPVIDIANLVENILQVLRAYQQIRKQSEQLDTMERNLQPIAETNWRDLEPLFDELNGRAQQGEALAYSRDGVFGAFRTELPGYVVMEPGQFADVYKKWTGVTVDTLAATLDSASLQAQEYDATQTQLGELQHLADGVAGNLQAQSAAHMIQGHMAQEVARLNQLLAASMNAQNVYFGTRLTLEGTAEATLRWMLDESREPFHVYTGQTGLPVIPDNWPYACWGCAG